MEHVSLFFLPSIDGTDNLVTHRACYHEDGRGVSWMGIKRVRDALVADHMGIRWIDKVGGAIGELTTG